MRLAARTDRNQREIVAALRKIGVAVTPLHRVGQGVSDLLCSFRQKWVVIECKVDREPLTGDQVKWISLQRAPVYVVTSAAEAVDFMQRIP